MPHIEGAIVIQRPVEEVFDVVADGRNEPGYNPQMRYVEQLTPGPLGPGMRFRCHMRRGVEVTTEITAYERPWRLGLAARSTVRLITVLPLMETQGTLHFEPIRHGTRMRWSWDVELCGAFRLLSPWFSRIGQHEEAVIWAGLKQVLEHQGRAFARAEDGV